jgi:hypothetical protein
VPRKPEVIAAPEMTQALAALEDPGGVDGT